MGFSREERGRKLEKVAEKRVKKGKEGLAGKEKDWDRFEFRIWIWVEIES